MTEDRPTYQAGADNTPADLAAEAAERLAIARQHTEWLMAELAAETQRRESAEWALGIERAAAASTVTHAEQRAEAAERERDVLQSELDRSIEQWTGELVPWIQRAEAAERQLAEVQDDLSVLRVKYRVTADQCEEGWTENDRTTQRAEAAERQLAEAQAGAFAQWQAELGQWGDVTFPNHHIGRTPASGPLYHLMKEAKELVEAYEAGEPIEGELADVGILSFQVAHRSGLSLYSVMQAKMKENRTREWGQPDEHGVVEHIAAGAGRDQAELGGRLADAAKALRGIIDVADHGTPISLIADLSAAIAQGKAALAALAEEAGHAE